MWGVLAIAAVLRVILILRGGQFSQLDENRYFDSRAGAAEIVLGHLRHGLALPLEKGDHVGYKEIGLIPALIERATGGDRTLIPSLFYGSFSLVAIGLMGGIAWRLTGSRRAQFWAVLLGATSGTLFYFARHLLPYDAAMAFILGGLYVAVDREFRMSRLLGAGALVGFGFVIYYGYWTLGGFALIFATVGGTPGWRGPYGRGFVARAVGLAAGLVAALAVPVVVNHAWGSGHMVQGARDLSGTIITGDFRGHLVPWEYLWYTDHLELPLAIGFMVAGAVAVWMGVGAAAGAGAEAQVGGGMGAGVERRVPEPRTPRWRRPETLALAGFLGIEAMFIVTGTWLHKFAVHDRLIRQLLPFLVVGAALGIEAWLAAARDRWAARRRAGWVAAILVANAAWSFATPLAQEWPDAFKRRGDAILARRTDPVSADAYFRYVNVLQYYSEPEVVKVTPLETLLQGPHFFQYRPYLYEGRTLADRARREQVDSSMRLVKVPIRPEWRIQHDRYGIVTLRLRLPVDRLNYIEPLLSLGPPGNGDFFFVRYYADTSVAFGFFATGQMIYETPRIAVAAGSEHEVQLLCGDLIPPGRGPAFDELRKTVLIKLDGRIILDRTAMAKDFPPAQVYAGVLAILGSYTTEDYSGEILSARRDDDLAAFLPHAVLHPGGGPMALRLRLVTGPGQVNSVEPLAVAGEPGHAALIYLRRLGSGRVRVGCEYWGIGSWESAPVATASPGQDRVDVELGAVLPDVGAKAWGLVGLAEQRRDKRTLTIWWNDAQVVHAEVPAWTFADPSLHIEVNPVGGSLVGPVFGGRVIESELTPLPADGR